MAAPSAPASLVPRLTSKATVKFWRTSMRPVDIAVPAWCCLAVVRVKTLFATLALPCGVSVTAPGGGVTVTVTCADLGVVPSVIV